MESAWTRFTSSLTFINAIDGSTGGGRTNYDQCGTPKYDQDGKPKYDQGEKPNYDEG